MKKIIISVVAIALLTGLFSSLVLAQEPVECEAEYTVKAGDWLSKIAKTYYGDATAYDQIVVASNARSDDEYGDISSPNSITAGQYLCLPPAPMAAPLKFACSCMMSYPIPMCAVAAVPGSRYAAASRLVDLCGKSPALIACPTASPIPRPDS